MRKEIYDKVSEALKELVDQGGERVVRHVGLWNHNVEFIEQEEGWDRPAVFIEFGTISWTPVKLGEYRGRGVLRLHIVTDWLSCAGASDGADVWQLCDAIDVALHGLSGETFHALRLLESHTNHNHEELVETIEVYEVLGVRRSSVIVTGKEVEDGSV